MDKFFENDDGTHATYWQKVQQQAIIFRLSIGKIVLHCLPFSLVLPGNAALKAAVRIVSLKNEPLWTFAVYTFLNHNGPI